MSKKIIVVPDVHGRVFWQKPVINYLKQVDKVVFLGDYLDPYEDDEGVAEDILANMTQILRLKLNNMEKVVLLKGNHDEHYSSTYFYLNARGSRCDESNWKLYHGMFERFHELFKIAHLEKVGSTTYVFTHAGLTNYWINKVNATLWNLVNSTISIDDPAIIERINQLDETIGGQKMLSIIGTSRSPLGEKTGSVLWADILEHPIDKTPSVYGLDKVFQVFGHTRMDGTIDDLLLYDHFAMIDTHKCFIIDEDRKEKILTTDAYEQA